MPKSPASNQPVVTFSLTVFVGDPDMYIAWDYTRPNATHNQARSASSGLAKDVIILYPPGQKDSSHAKSYWELATAVSGVQGGVVPTLGHAPVTHVDPTMGAMDAVQQQLEAQGMRVLSVARDDGVTSAGSGAAALRGGANRLLVAAQVPALGAGEAAGSEQFSALPPREPEHPLGAVGTGYCSVVTGPCTYYIGVTGYRSNASFAILARTSAANVTQLRDGQTVTDFVPQKEYQQYELRVSAAGVANGAELSVTTLAGDADVFVTVDGSRPSINNRQYYSQKTVGQDTISMRPGDGTWDQCGQ